MCVVTCTYPQHYPLRSVLLDPEANNFRPSRTRKELMKNIKDSGMPHRSYDIVSVTTS